jgi:hypothetical protein
MSPEYQSQLAQTFKDLTKKSKKKKSGKKYTKSGKNDRKVHLDMEDAEMIAENLLGPA